MADPVLRLDTPRVSVEPGGQAQVVVTVTSSSSIVEGFALDVVGLEPSRWAEVVPPSVDVYPGSAATAVVVFSPPAGAAAPSGDFAFGIRARSTENPDVSAVVEGDLTLGKVSGLQAKIIPVTSTGRWRGRHVIQLSNWGNTGVQLQLVATDPDSALGFYLRPDLVDLPIGGTATVRMTVRTRRPFLRGTPVRLPFQVVGEPVNPAPGPRPASPYGDPSRAVVDAALNQKPILSKAFITATALVLVAVIAGGVYAFTRKPPAVGSLEELGPPGKPKNFVVVATGPENLKATWTPIPQLTEYRLLEVDPETKVPQEDSKVDQSLGQKIIDARLPDTRYCFQLRGVRGTKMGPLSEVACARTPKLPPTPTPTPSDTASPGSPSPVGPSSAPPDRSAPPPVVPPTTPPPGSPTPDQLAGGAWVVIAGLWPQEASSETDAAALVTKLKDKGIPNASVMDTTKYPKLRLPTGTPPKPAWAAVVGPYPTPETASADLAKIQAEGSDPPMVVQPDPPG